MSNKKVKHVIHYILNTDRDQKADVQEVLNTLFLSDWKSALLRHGETISKMRWVLNENPLPATDDFWNALNSKNFRIDKVGRNYNNWIVTKSSEPSEGDLNDEEKEIIDFVREYIENSGSEINDLVSLSYPVFTNFENEDKKLDLRNMAEEYINSVRPALKAG